MANLKGSKAEQNLKGAFARESQANRCLFFARHADVEGYPEIAGSSATRPRVDLFDL